MKSIHRETEAQVKTAFPVTLTLGHVRRHWSLVWNGLLYFTPMFYVFHPLCFPPSLSTPDYPSLCEE